MGGFFYIMPSYQPSTYNFYSGEYSNPTAQPQSTQDFGTPQFAIDPKMQPFDFEKQSAQSADFRSRFGTFLEGLETPEATRQRFENRYGYQPQVEAFQQTGEALSGLGASISAAPEQIQGRTRGTLVTQSQLANIQNKEVGALIKQYNQLGAINAQQGKNLAITEQNMNDAAKLEMSQQQKLMTPWLQEYQDINIMQAREFSGWTFAAQLELNTLLANQAAGMSWSNAEAQRAHQLSLQEDAFQNSVDYLEKENEYAIELWG